MKTPASGAQLVLVPQHTELQDGAIVMGIHGQSPGGNARGSSAVDFQNQRALATQIAKGEHAFIAGGANNMAEGGYSHAQGYNSQTPGTEAEGAHAEGYAADGDTKQASAKGSHAEGLVNDSGSNITASGEGAHAEGIAESTGTLQATQKGSHAEGSASGSTIVAGGGTAGVGDGGAGQTVERLLAKRAGLDVFRHAGLCKGVELLLHQLVQLLDGRTREHGVAHREQTLAQGKGYRISSLPISS